MHPILIHLGKFRIPTFGALMAVAMFLGMYLAKRQGTKEGISAAKIESASMWAIISSLVGARFLYTFVEHANYYWARPWEFFALQSGGLSFLGSVFFAVAGLAFFCRKEKISFWHVADLMAPSLSIGLAIGKIGCFMAGCCFGKVCDLPWAVTFNDPETFAHPTGVPLHPTQLYEALAWTILFFVLIGFRRFRRVYGEVFFLFLILFGFIRSILETLRGDPGYLGPLTTAQMLSIPLVLGALTLWVLRRRQA